MTEREFNLRRQCAVLEARKYRAFTNALHKYMEQVAMRSA